MTKLPLLFALLAIPFSAPAAARPAIALAGRVTDEAHVLDAPAKAQLNRQLAAWEAATGHQMVVVTVRSLHGRDIKAFTTQLGTKWGVGRGQYDDGVILLVAPVERKVRIAVGYGLERSLPEAWCHRVILGEMIPRFRTGDHAGGLTAAVTAIVQHVGTTQLPVRHPARAAVPPA
nr:TPM domain-containing protein [Polymorphobacter sp.]